MNWVIAFTTPLFLSKSSSGPYFLFGACSLLTTLVCFAFQPETKGASLEEVDKAFEVSPWRVALAKHRSARLHARRQSGPMEQSREMGDDLDDMNVIELPEVRYGGVWHYAHLLT